IQRVSLPSAVGPQVKSPGIPARCPRSRDTGSAHKRLARSWLTDFSLACSWCLLHLDREDFAFQLRPGWRQGCHRPRQPNVTTESTDLHDEFVAFLKQFNLALGGERQKNTNLINAVLFPERVGFLGSGHG